MMLIGSLGRRPFKDSKMKKCSEEIVKKLSEKMVHNRISKMETKLQDVATSGTFFLKLPTYMECNCNLYFHDGLTIVCKPILYIYVSGC